MKVSSKCSGVLETHMNWLDRLKNRPEHHEATLRKIDEACELTELPQESCNIGKENNDKERAESLWVTTKAYGGSGEAFHGVCLPYNYKCGQTWADWILGDLND